MSKGCNVRLLALADDLTGALEIGGIFGGRGALSLVTTERTLNPHGLTGATSVLTIDTDSRHLPPEQAADRIAELARRAAAGEIPLIYKKTDSTLRGNIGAELRALMNAFPDRPLVYAPAYPKMGRTCKGGLLHVDGRPVHETSFAIDPLDPITDPCVRAKLAPWFQDSAVCEIRADELAEKIGRCDRAAVFVCDGEMEEDLSRTAQALVAGGRLKLAAGPAGLAGAIAQELDLPARERVDLPRSARSLTIYGSLHPVSRRQVKHAQAAGAPVITASREELMASQPLDGTPEGGLVARALETIRAHGHAILHTAPCPDRVRRPDIQEHEAHLQVARRIGEAVRALIAPAGLDALVICGGDTARAVLEALGHPSIEGFGEVAAGVPHSRFRAEGRELRLVTKAGGFGPVDVLCKIQEFLTAGQ